MRLNTIYFDYIKNKVKLYEIRVYDAKRREIKLLEILDFEDKDSNRKIKARIVELSYFKNFKEAIEQVGIKDVLPNAKSLKDGIEIYNNFPYREGCCYKDAAKNYGVLRMKFELL